VRAVRDRVRVGVRRSRARRSRRPRGPGAQPRAPGGGPVPHGPRASARTEERAARVTARIPLRQYAALEDLAEPRDRA